MASRETSPPSTPDGGGKKRKASSPLDDASTTRGRDVAIAFRKLILAAEQIYKTSEKTSPNKNAQWPLTLKKMAGRLWSSLTEYKELRYELDLEFRALEQKVVIVPAPEAPTEKPVCTDASTSMEMIPGWWDLTRNATPVIAGKTGASGFRRGWLKRQELHDEETDTDTAYPSISAHPREKAGPNRGQGAPRSYAAAVARNAPETSDTETYFEKVVSRRRRNSAAGARAPPKTETSPRIPLKPPAVIIRLKEGQTFAKTVTAIKTFVSPAELGAPIAKIRATKEGHAIFEFARSAKAHAAATKLSEEIKQKLGESVGIASQLGRLAEAEVVDLDPTVTEAEVLEALKRAVPASMTDAESEADLIRITGLWATRAGTQIATASMSRALLPRLSKVTIGWTVAKIRPRAPKTPRCYRCHGFGHDTRSCSGPDLTDQCRKCGENGHHEAQCTSGQGRCVACERDGHKAADHRTGSAGCLARRIAQAALREGARGRRNPLTRGMETGENRSHD